MIIQKDNKLINSLSGDNEELNLKKKNFFKKKKKKNGACVFLSTVFFLSLLAGKFAIFEQKLLTE